MAHTGTRVDAHVKVLDERVADRAKERGIDVLVYAPHFVRLPDVRETARHFSDDDLLVVPAREVFTGDWRNRRHVLAFGLSDPIPDFITFEGAMAEFDRQDAAVLAPHPGFMNVSLTRPEVDAHADRIDAAETYNAKLLGYQNRRMQRIADDLDLSGFGTSYAHLAATVGEAWTEFDRDVDTEADLVEAFKSGAERTVAHRSGPDHRLRGAIEFAHLGYENSWKKIDRLFLSGDVPTHPSNIFYDEAFDDVSVYQTNA